MAALDGREGVESMVLVESIRMAEQEHLPEAQRGALWAQLASEYQHATPTHA
jgi:hypothetical protein